MCVQSLIEATPRELIEKFSAISEPFHFVKHLFPRYFGPVLIQKDGRRLVPMQFGLIPSWDQTEKPKKVFHNARKETLHEKPSFHEAFFNRRCLIPITSFLEYVWIDSSKTQNWLARFYPRDRQILVAAGIWNERKDQNGKPIQSYSIITEPAPSFIQNIGHDRCPLFLREETFEAWIAPGKCSREKLYKVLDQKNIVEFEVEEVSKPPKKEKSESLAFDFG